MFVFLSKFLPQFVYPLGLSMILLALALIFQRRARLRNGLLIAALLILLLTSNRWVSTALVRSLEWRYLPPAQLPHAEAIVLLGGGTEAMQPPRPAVEVNGAGDRVLYAARLYKAGAAPRILLSGGTITFLGNRGSTPAEEMRDLLLLTGIPEDALWLQGRSQNTYEDALYSAKMLKEQGITRVILVTSAMHMPRSVALFEHQGIEVIPAPADYAVTQAEWDELTHGSVPAALISLLPNASNLGATTNALKEYLGMLAYRLRGWM